MNEHANNEVARLESQVADWIAYADKLEKVIEIVSGSAVDSLKRMQAEKGLRLVQTSRPRS